MENTIISYTRSVLHRTREQLKQRISTAGLPSGNTILSKTGQSWKLEPTYNIWSLMPIMSALDRDHMRQLALEIDTTSSNAELSLALSCEDHILCSRWRHVVESLDNDRVYHIADLMAMLLISYEDDLNYDWFSEGLLRRAAAYARRGREVADD